MELSNYFVSWVVPYLGDLQSTYIGDIIYLLSTMDIPVGDDQLPKYCVGTCHDKHPYEPTKVTWDWGPLSNQPHKYTMYSLGYIRYIPF